MGCLDCQAVDDGADDSHRLNGRRSLRRVAVNVGRVIGEAAASGALLLNGQPADVAGLRAAMLNYGHFTSMQVRNGAVQGLDLHLQRLQAATAELFGTALDVAMVRATMRAAVATQVDRACSLRVTVFARAFDFRSPGETMAADVFVAASTPVAGGGPPLRLKSYRFERTLPHVKHVGTFPLFHHARLATQAGFDDALFVGVDAKVSEGSLWNIGFWDGGQVVWPEAPALRGTCERLLQAGLAEARVPQATRPVMLAELADFRGAFAANSRGVMRIGAVDTVAYGPDDTLHALLAAALGSRPWQDI